MALDLSPDDQRRWLGFSPVVVVAVAALVLIAGAVMVSKPRGDGYVHAVTKLCAESSVRLDAEWKEKESLPIGAGPSLFQTTGGVAEGRLADLRALAPPVNHADAHAALIAGETAVADLARDSQTYVEERGIHEGEVIPRARAMIAAQQAVERRYVALGLPKGCFG